MHVPALMVFYVVCEILISYAEGSPIGLKVETRGPVLLYLIKVISMPSTLSELKGSELIQLEFTILLVS
jgi:hypothetical protein